MKAVVYSIKLNSFCEKNPLELLSADMNYVLFNLVANLNCNYTFSFVKL